MFPLGLLVLPKEQINLHIYEPRFKQLINDCFAQNQPFAIPFLESGVPCGKGILVRIVDIVRFYPDGKMDIIVEGLEFIKVKSIETMLNDKMYPGGVIEEYVEDLDTTKNPELQTLHEQFLKEELGIDFNLEQPKMNSINQILKDISADDALKRAVIYSPTMRSKEIVLINYMRLQRALKRQEELIQNRVFLN